MLRRGGPIYSNRAIQVGGTFPARIDQLTAGYMMAGGTAVVADMSTGYGPGAYIVGIPGPVMVLVDVGGSFGPSAILSQQISKAVVAGLTPTAPSPGRMIQKTAAGALTPGAVLNVTKVTKVLLTGGLSPGPGTLSRQAQKPLVGTQVSGGTLVKQGQKPLAGTVTSAGTLVRRVLKALIGGLTPTAVTVSRPAKVLGGAVTSAGIMLRRVAKPLTGAITPAGAVTTIKVRLATVTGALTPGGTIVRKALRPLTGTVTLAGTLGLLVKKIVSGTVTPTGTMATTKLIPPKVVAGVVTSTGALTRRAQKGLTGSMTLTGGLQRQLRKVLTGLIVPAGLTEKGPRLLFVDVGGTLTPEAQLRKLAWLQLTGQLGPTGTLGSTAFRVLTLYLTAMILPTVLLELELTRALTANVELTHG